MPSNGEARANRVGSGPAGRAGKEATLLLQLSAFHECEARKRRRQYRSSPPSRRTLKIYVGNERKRSWKGFIEDVSGGGARLSFPGEDHPKYALYDAVHLHILSPYLERPLLVPSTVTSRYESVERATYGFAFKKRPAQLIQLPAPLKQIFNRRRDPRVQPSPGQPIRVTFMDLHGERFETNAHDISAGGFSCVLVGDDAAFLAPGDAIDIQLRLPCYMETLRAKAVVSSREQVVGGLRLGAFFQPKAPDDLAHLKTVLAKYVANRRREIARAQRAAGRRSAPA